MIVEPYLYIIVAVILLGVFTAIYMYIKSPKQDLVFPDMGGLEFSMGFEGDFPEKYTCDGENVSPPIEIENVPEEAETLAVTLDDPDAPGTVFHHWVVWNLPVDEDIPEDIDTEKAEELGAVYGQNSYGQQSYRGPCPPGGRHRYRITVYALDEELDLESGATREEFDAVVEDSLVAVKTNTREYMRE